MNLTFLDPGNLTARLELEAPEETSDGQGGVTPGWRQLRQLWAAFRTDIAAGMRLKKGARIFAVISVIDPDETGRFIVCRCEEESR